MADLNSTIVRGNLRVTDDENVNGNLKVGGTITENGTSLANKYAPKSHNHTAAATTSTATTLNTYSMSYSNGVLTITSGTTNVASTSHTHGVS